MPSSPRRACATATLTAVVALAVLATGAAPAGAATTPVPAASSANASAVPDGHDTPPGKQSRLSFGSPVNVRVTTSASGMTVFATPVCSGYKSCRSWFVVPGFGIDVKDVTTTSGYFVPWPSSWREGQTVTSGYVHSYGRDIFGSGWYSGSTTTLGSITRPYSARGITARLSSQDDTTRTAYVTGTATPSATIRRNNITVAIADQYGNWNASVAGLPIGTSSLTFQQYVGGNVKDQATVSVTFLTKNLLTGLTGETTALPAGTTTTVFANLRVDADFAAPLSKGTVVVTAPEGTTFPRDLSSIRGQYRAASGGDWVDFATDNLVDGTVAADGGTATFSWAPSATTGWALTAGMTVRFGIPTVNPGASEGAGTLRAVATGSAAQGTFDATATTPVTRAAAALEPVTLTGPATVSPGASNTFTGTATGGGTIEVVDASGTVIVPGGPFPVDGAGKWSFSAAVPAGVTEYRFAIRQTANGKTATSELFTVPADTFAAVTVANGTVRDGIANTFAGTATAGATYRVLNISNTEIVSGGPFSIDDHGRWRFDRVVSKGATEFRFKLEQRKDGHTVRSQLFTIPVG